MLDFKALKKTCAACPKIPAYADTEQHNKCKKCDLYRILNTPCDFCGRIGGVTPLCRHIGSGPSVDLVCEKCLAKLT